HLRNRLPNGHVEVAHVGEPLGLQQVLGHVLRRPTRTRRLDQPEFRRLRWGLGSDSARTHAHETRRSRDRHFLQEFSSRVHPFSSFFSSLRKRQSVPWAMIFCGVALMRGYTFPEGCAPAARGVNSTNARTLARV